MPTDGQNARMLLDPVNRLDAHAVAPGWASAVWVVGLLLARPQTSISRRRNAPRRHGRAQANDALDPQDAGSTHRPSPC